MISEKWNLNLEVDKLRDQILQSVVNKEITKQSSAFGGWSVLSSNGDYKDGWQRGHLLLDPNTSVDLQNQIKSTLNKKFSEYTVETELCMGYLKTVIEKIRSFDLSPSRARIICLTAGQSSIWHRDARSNVYAVRLHVPIITNSGCFFETHDEREHMPADGSGYFVYVNREHRVFNNGQEDRFHLVMDVVDRNQTTKFHRVEDFNMISQRS